MAANTFPARVIELGVVGYWRLGEDSGTAANDSSGNSNTGTHQASPTLNVTGSLSDNDDGAVTYAAASSQWTSVTDHATLDQGNGPLSWMVAFKRSSSGDTASRYLMSKGNQAPVLWLTTSGAGSHRLGWGALNWSDVTFCNTLLTDTLWHLAIGVKSTTANDWRIYLDGQNVTSQQDFTSITTIDTAVDLNIGRRSSASDNWMDGSLDEVAIFNVALTSFQVSELYSLWKSNRSALLLSYGVSQDRERI